MDLAELNARIREYRAGSSSNIPKPVDQEVTVPLRMERPPPEAANLKKNKYEEFIGRLEAPVIDPRTVDMPELTDSADIVTMDFPDHKLLGSSALILDRMEDEHVADLGRKVIPMISSGFSVRGAGGLFLLAYHLYDEYNSQTYAIDDADPLFLTTDVPLNLLPDRLSAGGHQSEPLPATADVHDEARMYSYVAASLLRLYTKSEDNYVKAFNHILTGYHKFYGQESSPSIPMPTAGTLKSLCHMLSHNSIFKATLFRLLYLGTNKRSEGLKRFLYEIHLSNTGMHALGIFIQLFRALNCTSALLANAAKSGIFERQFEALIVILKIAARTDGEHARKMWRFGRIFDETFMTPLQTKRCPGFVYALAVALKQVSAKSNQNILDIVQFEELSAEMKEQFHYAGLGIIRRVRLSQQTQEVSAFDVASM
ncbi:coat protein [Vitis varicosavirus]|uniref:Nucleoprotein n=1 Tax=Vitis varicosavirus TaxID=2812030 RepID=A0A830ZTU0_9RHAB|nr:coat protein [Vitis varicosavirus]BCS90309.1 coat protein [Vitis varicosavirus]